MNPYCEGANNFLVFCLGVFCILFLSCVCQVLGFKFQMSLLCMAFVSFGII